MDDEGVIVAWAAAPCTCLAARRLVNAVATPGQPFSHMDECPRAHLDLASSWYEIRRAGTPKKEGGPGVVWTCSCPSRRYRGRCWHLTALFQGWVTEDPNDRSLCTPSPKTPWGGDLGIEVVTLVRLAPDTDWLRADLAAKLLRRMAQDANNPRTVTDTTTVYIGGAPAQGKSGVHAIWLPTTVKYGNH